MNHDRIHRDLDIQQTGKDVEKIDGQKGKDKKNIWAQDMDVNHIIQHNIKEKRSFSAQCTVISNEMLNTQGVN
jgi:hypothetical protein